MQLVARERFEKHRQGGQENRGRVAQLGERRPYKPEVTGSSPVPPTSPNEGWAGEMIRNRTERPAEQSGKVTGSSPVPPTSPNEGWAGEMIRNRTERPAEQSGKVTGSSPVPPTSQDTLDSGL